MSRAEFISFQEDVQLALPNTTMQYHALDFYDSDNPEQGSVKPGIRGLTKTGYLKFQGSHDLIPTSEHAAGR